jgi:hypothetical protein
LYETRHDSAVSQPSLHRPVLSCNEVQSNNIHYIKHNIHDFKVNNPSNSVLLNSKPSNTCKESPIKIPFLNFFHPKKKLSNLAECFSDRNLFEIGQQPTDISKSLPNIR